MSRWSRKCAGQRIATRSADPRSRRRSKRSCRPCRSYPWTAGANQCSRSYLHLSLFRLHRNLISAIENVIMCAGWHLFSREWSLRIYWSFLCGQNLSYCERELVHKGRRRKVEWLLCPNRDISEKLPRRDSLWHHHHASNGTKWES